MNYLLEHQASRRSGMVEESPPDAQPVAGEPVAGAQQLGAQHDGLDADSADAEPGGVVDFYRDSVVFITGATGFMGLVLLEKLLRACRVRKVFLLIRPKRGKDVQARLADMLADPLFDQVRSRVAKLEERLAPVEGDCALPGLGLREQDRAALLAQVHVVFHVAASVRFDEPLRYAAAINVRGTQDVIKLAKEMPNFKALVHVSTAFAHCHRKHIGEAFYKPGLQAHQLSSILDSLPDDKVDAIIRVILDKWPNTYTYTKAIAEETVREEAKGMPVAVVRPSMVICTAAEPVRGWVNNLNGPAGVVAGVGLGVLRTLNNNGRLTADLVPADMVINATIVAAWDAHRRHQERSKHAPRIEEVADSTVEATAGAATADSEELPSDIPVFNYVSSARNPITWKRFMYLNEKTGTQWASFHVQWYYCLFLTRYAWMHAIQKVLLHLLPALVVDTCALLIGRKPMMLKAYRKIHKFTDVIAYFCTQSWNFRDDETLRMWRSLSVREQKLFPFNIADLDWEDAVAGFIPGMRLYLLKDSFDTLPAARKYYRKLKWAHYGLVTCLWLLLLRMLWAIVCVFV
ncbi:fatty acyl-CoA reductase wat-like [Schistocerca cancellata]|uniref:fatty acyl-CoA reductase wat-like n=1 Tax=Schistocerca cancellata TaxID=274614 RepID=UPI0021173DFA|nr:fatty acyl-CoA reductase wat-like [Schistocerca cancellata]